MTKREKDALALKQARKSKLQSLGQWVESEKELPKTAEVTNEYN